MARKTKPTRVRYIARNGEFLAGVPAIDMTSEQWEAVPEEMRTQALALGLYELSDAPAISSEVESES